MTTVSLQVPEAIISSAGGHGMTLGAGLQGQE
jgi:hypothetical protein